MYYFPSTWNRFMAHALDKLYIGLLQGPVIVNVLFEFFKKDEIRFHWSYLVYYALVAFMYEFISLWFFSTTLGKWQMNLVVIDRDAVGNKRPISWDQAVLRILTSKLSFFFGLSVQALALFKYNRTHLADWIAGTQVVALEPRSKNPGIRWVLASLFLLISTPESIKSAALVMQSLRWQNPYIHYEDKSFKALVDEIESRIEDSDED